VRSSVDHRLAFAPLTAFLTHVLATLRRVPLLFAIRIRSDALAEYVAGVLSGVREIDAEQLNRGAGSV
jgi:hypothetical protein